MDNDNHSNSNGNNPNAGFKWDPLRFISKYPGEVLKKVDKRLDALEKKYFNDKKDKEENLPNILDIYGVSRRDFLKWSAFLTSALMLPYIFEPRVARAANILTRTPFIWLDMADCMGNTEAFIRNANPTPAEIILNYVSVNYMESIMAPAGYQAEARRIETVKKDKGKYILVVEGAIPTGMDGKFLTIGAKGDTGLKIVKETAKDAGIVIAIGNCAAYGGIPAAAPNPTAAVGLSSVTNRKRYKHSRLSGKSRKRGRHPRRIYTYRKSPSARQYRPSAMGVFRQAPRQLLQEGSFRSGRICQGMGRRRSQKRILSLYDGL
jgi:Ni,Fe-hydrogenase I small subunit